MMNLKNFIIFILIFIFQFSYSFDAATHMALASQSPEILEGLDGDFYNFLITQQNDPWEEWKRLMAWKFFLIGTTLPDLFWGETQRIVAELIEELYNNRSNFRGPLNISDSTYWETRIRINFVNDAHHNVKILKR
ncbi:MAG: hypothetical protein NZ891_04970, partial [bacterium]|nr:hypothetical protein [bacterium]MDW8164076.1 hypothetical protein [Candidatus Omnitrophota bacterium]